MKDVLYKVCAFNSGDIDVQIQHAHLHPVRRKRIAALSRKEAIAAVEANGGKAYETMPVSTTLLVVGDNPGNGKLDKADMWRTRKITAKQFNTMCNVRVMVN